MQPRVDRSRRSPLFCRHGTDADIIPIEHDHRCGVGPARHPGADDPLVGTPLRLPGAGQDAGQAPPLLRRRDRPAPHDARRDHPRALRQRGRRHRSSLRHRGSSARRAARPLPRGRDAPGPGQASRGADGRQRVDGCRGDDARRRLARDARDGQPLEGRRLRHRARAPRDRGRAGMARPAIGDGTGAVPPVPARARMRAEGPAHDRPRVVRRRARPSRLVDPHPRPAHAGDLARGGRAGGRGARRGRHQPAERHAHARPSRRSSRPTRCPGSRPSTRGPRSGRRPPARTCPARTSARTSSRPPTSSSARLAVAS